jgi:hypothetical protein
MGEEVRALIRRISTGLSTGLSREFIDELSKLPWKHYAGEHAPPHGHARTLRRVRLLGVTVPCAALPQPWRLH